MTSVNVDLAGTIGGGAGDGAPIASSSTRPRQRRNRCHRGRRWRQGERPRGDDRDPPLRLRATNSRSPRSPVRTPSTQPGWRPVQSSSSWTAFSSRRSQIRRCAGPHTRGPRKRRSRDRRPSSSAIRLGELCRVRVHAGAVELEFASSIRRIFPVSVFGSPDTNSTRRGYVRGRRSRTCPDLAASPDGSYPSAGR